MTDSNSFEGEMDNAYYQVENRILGVDVTAYVENEVDALFWHQIFEKFAPDLKIVFRFNSHNNLVRGKQEILKSKSKLGNAFILCLDSDFDYLLQNKDLCDNPYIFQTYAYSIETFKCNPQNLNRLCRDASLNPTLNFDFEEFLKNLSKIYFPFLLYVLNFKKNGKSDNEIQRRNLENTLNIPRTQTLDISQNGQKIIDNFKHKFDQIIKKFQKKYTKIDVNPIKESFLNDFSLKESDAWQFIIGHILYDNMEILLERVVKELADLKKEELKKQKSDTKKNVLTDKLNEYAKQLQKLHIPTLLFVNHQKCFIHNNCPLLLKIQTDIQNFIRVNPGV